MDTTLHPDALLTRAAPSAPPSARPRVDGKFFRAGDERLWLRGVTYGTFADGPHGAFGTLAAVRADFAAMAAHHIDTVRTYTVPGPAVLDAAAEHGLRLLIGVWWDDPRYLPQPTAHAWNATAAAARAAVADAVAACGSHPAVLGFLVGNEIPAPVVRWYGHRRVERLLADCYQAAKDVDSAALVGYANYPTTGYLDTSTFDFEACNVFLEDAGAFRRYLAELQVRSGDRPLVVTELGVDAGSHGAAVQAELLDAQLRAALEQGAAGACVFSWTDEWWVDGQQVEGWRFGLTDGRRAPRSALRTVGDRYREGLGGTRRRWPRVSVVVCAYNEEMVIGGCLTSLASLRYPDYEVVVVDDGSTDATAEVARRHDVRVLSEGHGGLSAARNLGLREATGEVVAYLDADAYADPDWLRYLVLGLDAPGAVGVGGPNLVPRDDPPLAQCIAAAGGGPVHVMIDDERAEHVPGCNMAFRHDALTAIGGFDTVFRTAGDDLDVCWRLQEHGGEIRFHAAAVVWHHPRQRVAAFWRQQIGYGRAEALVARRHPERFTAEGRARWAGVIYGPAPLLRGRSVLYTGRFGDAPYQRRAAHGGATRAQLGAHRLWAPAVAALRLLQPTARALGQRRGRRLAPGTRGITSPPPLVARGRAFVAHGAGAAARERLLDELAERLRDKAVATTAPVTGEADLRCTSLLCWRADVVAYAPPFQGDVYVRVALRPRPPKAASATGVGLLAAVTLQLGGPAAALVSVLAVIAVDGLRLRRRLRAALTGRPG